MNSIPNWAWGIICGAFVLLLGIIAYLISNLITRYKEDISKALEQTERVRDTTCSFHQESFQRVHDLREKSASAIESSIGELNKNIGELKTATEVLSVHIETIAEKHADNKASIEKLDGRVTTIEKRITD
jgi:F0F1-type ATP synthase membrane subunit b/b'